MFLLTKTQTRDRRGGDFEPVCPLVYTEIGGSTCPISGRAFTDEMVVPVPDDLSERCSSCMNLDTKAELSARCCEPGKYSTFDDLQSTLGAKAALCHGRWVVFQPPVIAIEAKTTQNVLKPLCRRYRCLTTMENRSWQTTQRINGGLGPVSAGVSRRPISAQQSRAVGRCDVDNVRGCKSYTVVG